MAFRALVIAVAVFATGVICTITEEDKQAMAQRCDELIAHLETVRAKNEEIVEDEIRQATALLDPMSERAHKCKQEPIRKFRADAGFTMDEAFGGYIRSTEFLKEEILSDRLDDEELKHTQHMLLPNGKYETQMNNSIRHARDEITRYSDIFISEMKECAI